MSRTAKNKSRGSISDIREHSRHPIHRDRALVEKLRSGDASAIRQLRQRAKPYIENFASDRYWKNSVDAYDRGWKILENQQFSIFNNWNPQARSLSQHIEYTLRNELRKEIFHQREKVRRSSNLAEAVKRSIDHLSETHYWILIKILVERIRPKKLLRMLADCPDVRIRSLGSIGSTYSRALQKLQKVCPAEYRDLVDDFIRTRQRSGRFS